MIFYLMQHGQSFSKEENREEGLTPRGRETLRAMAGVLKGLGASPTALLASPKARARHSAELMAAVLGPQLLRNLRVTEHLKPGADPHATVSLLRELGGDGPVLAVGHLPNLAKTVGLLVAGSPDEVLVFERGGVCCLEQPEPNWPDRKSVV